MKRLLPLSMLGASALLVAVHTAGAVPIPTLYYDFEESTGATVTNKGSLGGTGTVLGTGANLAVGGVPGSSTPGSGILFNDDHTATGGRVATGYSSEQLGFRKNGSGATNYTATAWFSSAQVPTVGNNDDQMIFGQVIDSGGFLHHGIRGSNLHFGHWGNDVTAAAGTAVANEPTHVAYTYTAGFTGIYRNGILQEGTYEQRGGLNNNNEIIIGKSAGDNRDFNGTLDDVAVYNTSLTLGQIIHLSKGGDPLADNIAPLGPDGGDGFAGVRVVTGNGDISRVDRAIRSLAQNETLGLGTATNTTVPYLNFQDPDNNTGGSHNFAAGGSAVSSAKIAFPGGVSGVNDEDFAMIVNGTIQITSTGDYTFGFAGDDGAQFILEGADFTKQGTTGDGNKGTALGNAMVFRDDTGDSETLASTFLEEGLYSFELIFNENGGGAFFELFAAQGIKTAIDGDFRIVGDVAFGGLALVERPLAVPEPATALFGLLAMGALGIRRRRVA